MNFYNYSNCPEKTVFQIMDTKDYLIRYFKDNLVGIYLHGSLVLNCFNEQNSDIDLICIIKNRLSVEERVSLSKIFCKINYKPSPLEISVININDLVPWQFPTLCQFHFSEYWQPRYVDFIERNDFSHVLLTTDFEDCDIACHVKLIKQSGICLYGSKIEDVFPTVPENDFIASVTSDINDFDMNSEDRVYNILTLCRIWSYFKLGRIISKYDGAIWAQNELPTTFLNIIKSAVNEKYENCRNIKYKENELQNFKEFIINKITGGAVT